MWTCYILRSINPKYPNKTYVGSTNDITRRLEQHNKELSGGAKATSWNGPHEMYCIISGFLDHSSVLRFEYLLKHPLGKSSSKYSGIDGRVKGLNFIINELKCIDNINITINIKDDKRALLEVGHHNNITINII